jgi:hypothetical protein
MKRTFVLIAIIAIAAVLLLASCSNDDKIPVYGLMTFEGNAITFVGAVIIDGGQIAVGEYDLQFWATAAGADLINETGQSNLIKLFLISPTPTLATGIYAWADPLQNAYDMKASVFFTYQLPSGPGTEYAASGGTVTVNSVSGNEYSLEFSLDINVPDDLTGRYDGPAVPK